MLIYTVGSQEKQIMGLGWIFHYECTEIAIFRLLTVVEKSLLLDLSIVLDPVRQRPAFGLYREKKDSNSCKQRHCHKERHCQSLLTIPHQVHRYQWAQKPPYPRNRICNSQPCRA